VLGAPPSSFSKAGSNKMSFRSFVDSQAIPTIIATAVGVANAAGTGNGNGASVSTPVTFTDQYGNGRLPMSLNFVVNVTPSQACFATVSNKSITGFTVTLTPLSGVTLAAGSFDVTVCA
jgi:hypothetical protein